MMDILSVKIVEDDVGGTELGPDVGLNTYVIPPLKI